MFEPGTSYEIRMIVDGDETTMWRTVESYDHPLLKFADKTFAEDSMFLPGGTIRGEIINVTSPNFISATVSKQQD